MMLGSHNSWSFLPVRKWWMKPLAFMARCQSVDIRKQYELGVRCFDLRLRLCDDGMVRVVHGPIVYNALVGHIRDDIKWLDGKGDPCYIRIIHDVRSESQRTKKSIEAFRYICNRLDDEYLNIIFWCGRNLYNWETDYDFGVYPTCDEKYASVCSPKIIDDWWPWFFARFHNRKILAEGTDKDVLLMDFVNIR